MPRTRPSSQHHLLATHERGANEQQRVRRSTGRYEVAGPALQAALRSDESLEAANSGVAPGRWQLDREELGPVAKVETEPHALRAVGGGGFSKERWLFFGRVPERTGTADTSVPSMLQTCPQTRCSSDPRRQSLAEVESSVKPRCRRTQGQRLDQRRVERRRRAPASRSGRRPQHRAVAREQPPAEQVVQQPPQLRRHRARAQRRRVPERALLRQGREQEREQGREQGRVLARMRQQRWRVPARRP